MSNVRVVVADDHPMFRYGLVAALATAPDVKVVGEAVDGLELLTVVQREQPDVVLTDLTMPGLNDCWPTSPALRVVVLTMHEDDEAVFQAMRACAHGFLVKGADVQDILRAVLAVAAGGAVHGPTGAQFSCGSHRRSRILALDAAHRVAQNGHGGSHAQGLRADGTLSTR